MNFAQEASAHAEHTDLPLPLRPLADSQRATVRFQPLLVAGRIAVVDGGFVVYIRASTREVDTLHACFDDPRDGGRSLDVRRRFTLAHELAHSFLFDDRGPDDLPRKPVAGTHASELAALERVCNEAAGLVLVPDRLVSSYIRTNALDLLSYGAVQALQDKFRVSPDVLIIRLAKLLPQLHAADLIEHGGILLIERRADTTAVQHIALTPDAYRLFERKGGALDLSALTTQVPLVDSQSHECRIPCLYSTRRAIQEAVVTVAWLSRTNERALVTLRLKGSPQLV